MASILTHNDTSLFDKNAPKGRVFLFQTTLVLQYQYIVLTREIALFSISKKQRGFTLIELVVVIIVLAILAVISAQKFLDIKRDAAISDVKATAAAYQQSLTFVHTRWQILGNQGAMNDLPGFGNNDLDINSFGYPIGSDKGNPMGQPKNIGRGQQGCVDLWNGLLTNPPSVAIANSNNDSDYESYRHQADVNPDGQTQCTYVLRTLGDSGNRNQAEIKIVYDSIAGTAQAVIKN